MSRQPTGLASLVSFPNPVNEVMARTVAAGVVLLGLATVLLQLPWLSAVLAAGFLLRVLSGPRFSPLALVASRLIVPRLPFRAKLVPGPPKRFAQTIGLVFSASAGVLFLLGLETAGYVVIAALVVAASLEAFAGLCLGCQAFALLIRAGVIPQEVCEACNDIWARRASAAP
ncbi:DUF4395 domain-containing protein [Conexibacter sp. JD483]|uniref:DUF4395 domain-containing protein n=1 Tax=unclassified Conexibacter TaxID=2627773 RepID=UPI002717EE34|nr:MULTISPECIES: DUF4395 domain-containing protein [unclassified Conexibacter]MDO8189545.1 DUF4395 domain-containing protein [Conexibacter sp. CPCC 205706]MDO8200563.1 DUF4395 domain-containing protein [Conexibacter sp. CPCC 205762]MDR9372904.1 DUF4395 domain-containing protein [Conexibacter sp. JD483]